jgi:hypothetical protein
MVFLTELSQKVYLTQQEEPAKRNIRNKQHRTKVMFLPAVSHPCFNVDGNCTFDGKIGMWPFVVRQPAQRASVNRLRGTIVTTPINVDYDTYLRYMLEKVLPAIKEKFPRKHARD